MSSDTNLVKDIRSIPVEASVTNTADIIITFTFRSLWIWLHPMRDFAMQRRPSLVFFRCLMQWYLTVDGWFMLYVSTIRLPYECEPNRHRFEIVLKLPSQKINCKKICIYWYHCVCTVSSNKVVQLRGHGVCFVGRYIKDKTDRLLKSHESDMTWHVRSQSPMWVWVNYFKQSLCCCQIPNGLLLEFRVAWHIAPCEESQSIIALRCVHSLSEPCGISRFFVKWSFSASPNTSHIY